MTGAKWVRGVNDTEPGMNGCFTSTNWVRPGSPISDGMRTSRLGRIKRHETFAADRQPRRVNTGATAKMASG